MKELLVNYDVLYFMMAVTAVSVLAKGIGVAVYRRLIQESGQMATTGNRWLKSMMAKFEAYYKLRISVHNVENFVDRYLFSYRFMGISLISWENAGYYGICGILGTAALSAIAAGYYNLPEEWFMALGFTGVSLMLVHGTSELLFHSHRHGKIFRIQLIDYMENTMRARLENEYFNQEENVEYQMEYFGENSVEKADEEQEESPEKEIKDKPVLENSLEMKELLSSLLEEMQVDREIKKKQGEMGQDSTTQRAQLFEEVLKEYM